MYLPPKSLVLALPAGGMAVWGRLDKAALEACLCTVALALATVMAGSGHLPTLRLLRGAPLALTIQSKPVRLPVLCQRPQWVLGNRAPAHAARAA